MATTFLARRACALQLSSSSLNLPRPTCGVRTLHASAIARKKKAHNDAVVEDLFADDTSGDLFSDAAASQSVKPTPTTPATTRKSWSRPVAVDADGPVVPSNLGPKRATKLELERRTELFEELAAFVEPRIGRKPTSVLPKIRYSAWTQLVMFAHSKEQLERIAEMFAGWKKAGNPAFGSQVATLFVRRCEQIAYPDLAIQVFGNYPKYQIPLTLPAARALLHSVHKTEPIEKVMTVSALYGLYGLTPVAYDLVSCAMTVVACLKADTKESNDVAEALISSLKDLLAEETEESATATSGTEAEQSIHASWLKWTLKRIDKVMAMRNGGRREEWLVDWRVQNGHLMNILKF